LYEPWQARREVLQMRAGYTGSWRIWVTPGDASDYQFAYRTAQADLPFPGGQTTTALGGELDVEGSLRFLGYGLCYATATTPGIFGPIEPGEPESSTHICVGLQLRNLVWNAFGLLGKDVTERRAELAAEVEGHEALLELDAYGRVVALRTAEATPPLFRYVAQALALDAQLVQGPAKAADYASEEISPRGQLSAVYHADVEHGTLTKAAPVYRKLFALAHLRTEAPEILCDGQTEATLVEQGLTSLRVTETLAVSDEAGQSLLSASTRLTLQRDATKPLERLPMAAHNWEAFEPTFVNAKATPTAKELAAMAGTLTPAQLRSDLRSFGGAGTMPNHSAWLMQAQALLRLHPELCAELVELFQLPYLGSRGRNLILDLLANAGTPEAQLALSRALKSDTAMKASATEQAAAWQRLAFVQSPTPETLAFAEGGYRDSQGPLHDAATLSLGSLLGAAAEHGDEAGEERLRTLLTQDLTVAPDTRTRARLLDALGNASLPETAALVAGFANDLDPQVRKSAARALRNQEDVDSQAVLIRLLADPDPRVQAAALAALAQRGLTSDTLAALTTLVADHALASENVDAVLNLLAVLPDQGAVLALYRLILAQVSLTSETEARLRTLLE